MGFDDYRRLVTPGIEGRLAALVVGQELEGLYAYAVAGGKRVRPALTLLVAEALGAGPGAALDLACSVELTHSASLVLDDIIDAHRDRRGKASIHQAQGLKMAVTTGFTLPSLALHLAARHGPRAAELLTEAWVSMCLGVLHEDDSWGLPLEERYMAIVDAKTSRLFSTAAVFGALAVGRGDLEEGLRTYGLHLGRAFQMADDLVDAAEGEGALPPTLAGEEAEVLGIARRRLPQEVALAEAAVAGVPDFVSLRAAPAEIVRLKEQELQ